MEVAQKQAENAVERLKRRITDRIDADRERPQGYRHTQQGLAERIGITKQTLNELLNGPAATRGLLAHLDRIGEYFGVPPSLLIHKNDTALMELQQGEYRLIQHWRTLPPDVQESISALFDYFAGLLPEEKEERRLWQRWRRLSLQSRARLDGILEDALKDERLAKRATRGAPAAGDRTVENAPPTRAPRRRGQP